MKNYVSFLSTLSIKNCKLNNMFPIRCLLVSLNFFVKIIRYIAIPVKKIQNRFIYSSCSERGLKKLIDLWPQIIEHLPDAELYISTYNEFPRDDNERNMEKKISEYASIKHLGNLDKSKLYELIATAEYWMYPSYFNETSCITSMEMLMSEVICLYYPVAGLINTLGDYGIKISEGSEIDSLLDLTMKRKSELRKNGKSYEFSGVYLL